MIAEKMNWDIEYRPMMMAKAFCRFLESLIELRRHKNNHNEFFATTVVIGILSKHAGITKKLEPKQFIRFVHHLSDHSEMSPDALSLYLEEFFRK